VSGAGGTIWSVPTATAARHGSQPLYFAISAVLVAALLAVFWLAGSGRLS